MPNRIMMIDRAQPVALRRLAASAAVGLLVGLTTAASRAAVAPPPDHQAACGTGNPYLVTACYPMSVAGNTTSYYTVLEVFRDTPDDGPHETIAVMRDVGSVYGLAYSSSEGAVYAAAFHKRAVGFGPAGPGAVYRVDLATRRVAEFTAVPDAGDDHHGNQIDEDAEARDWAGMTSLGDLDLSEDERELFVVNLFDRRIYRFQVASGRLLGAFPHGAAAEAWAADARPFGLKIHDGHLYHGVVHSAQSSRAPADLAGYVYESLPDGSAMRLVLRVPLDYERGVARIQGLVNNPGVKEFSLRWLPWRDGINTLGLAQMSVYPQPILSDIEFDLEGNMILGIRDRHGDMTLGYQSRFREKPGLGVGDMLRAARPADDWVAQTVPEPYYDRTSLADESLLGGLAQLPVPDLVVSGALLPTQPMVSADSAVNWYRYEPDLGRGSRLAHEPVCRSLVNAPPTPTESAFRLNRLHHNEWIPSHTIGDLEVLCGRSTPEPPSTPSPTTTPTATGSPSPPPSPTGTATTSPSRTPRPGRIYVPILPKPCDPEVTPVDVVLAIDASSSMNELTSAERPKIDAAREAAALFIERLSLPGDQAAIVTFNVEAALVQGLTGDRAALRAGLGRIEVRQFTRIDLGIRRAHEELIGPRHRRANTPAMIVLTDGRNNPGPVSTALERAAEAKGDGIRLFTIGLGEHAEAEALRSMASQPQDYFFAPDGEDLARIYERIAGAVPCPPGETWPEGR